ncbi:hypothetical protein Q5P01_020048 [Channa striata]|uniref:Uncharacterized protein n=1 Tax=Channa striata TaxID=64152 RepID=A0AA88S2T5_CHASR|nr:hypothetical protein Q5P01_020048 [Channa striata]
MSPSAPLNTAAELQREPRSSAAGRASQAVGSEPAAETGATIGRNGRDADFVPGLRSAERRADRLDVHHWDLLPSWRFLDPNVKPKKSFITLEPAVCDVKGKGSEEEDVQ